MTQGLRKGLVRETVERVHRRALLVVISGLNAGVYDKKTKEERDYYDGMLGRGKGGIAGVEHDPCYHDSCGSLANINPIVHEKMTQGAAYVLEYLGRHSDLHSYLYPQEAIRLLKKTIAIQINTTI